MKKALTIGLGIVSGISFASAQSSIGSVVAAPSASSASGLLGLIGTVQQILDRAVPLIVSLAVIGLFWFLLQFVWKGSQDAKAREDAIKGIGFSILAIFVMVAIWGIIAFIANVVGVGVGGDASAIVPKLTK